MTVSVVFLYSHRVAGDSRHRPMFSGSCQITFRVVVDSFRLITGVGAIRPRHHRRRESALVPETRFRRPVTLDTSRSFWIRECAECSSFVHRHPHHVVIVVITGSTMRILKVQRGLGDELSGRGVDVEGRRVRAVEAVGQGVGVLDRAPLVGVGGRDGVADVDARRRVLGYRPRVGIGGRERTRDRPRRPRCPGGAGPPRGRPVRGLPAARG